MVERARIIFAHYDWGAVGGQGIGLGHTYCHPAGAAHQFEASGDQKNLALATSGRILNDFPTTNMGYFSHDVGDFALKKSGIPEI